LCFASLPGLFLVLSLLIKHLSHVLLMVVGFVVVANFWDVNWVGRGSSGYTTNEVE